MGSVKVSIEYRFRSSVVETCEHEEGAARKAP